MPLSINEIKEFMGASEAFTFLGCIDAKDVENLVAPLKIHLSLKKLHFGENNIAPQGAIALAEALKFNGIIEELNFGKSNIAISGGKAIAEVLKDHPSIKRLHLGESNIGARGAIAFAQALSFNTKLQELSFGKSNISIDGAKAIAESLKKNKTLKMIHLGQSTIGDEGLEAILDSLKTNLCLIKFEGYINKNTKLEAEINLKLEFNRKIYEEVSPIQLINRKSIRIAPSLKNIALFAVRQQLTCSANFAEKVEKKLPVELKEKVFSFK